MNRILIAGVAGQDGTLLAESLARRGIEHAGLTREGFVGKDGALIRPGSLDDPRFIEETVTTYSPTHIYYLAAHHHSSQDLGPLKDSDLWRESLRVQIMGLVNFLEAIHRHRSEARLFYASSAHIFGQAAPAPQSETTPRMPDNVYGITKLAGMEACRLYREQHGVFASVGILYNHESAYRKGNFLSKKIIRGAMAIKSGEAAELVLGDLSSKADWGYAPDYVDAMARILDLPHPGEYVVATGEAHSVRDFVRLAFEAEGLDYKDWVRENPSIIRSSQRRLVGDSGKLRRETGWRPSLSFPEMVSQLAKDDRRLRVSLGAGKSP